MEARTFKGPDGEDLVPKVLKARELGALRRWLREGLTKGQEIPDEDFWAKSIVTAAQRTDGTMRFTAADVEAIKDMPGFVVGRMFKAVAQPNGLTDEADEEIRKN